MNKGERAALIRDAIKRAKTEALNNNMSMPQARVWCKEVWRSFPIYKIPVDALMLNIDNRRFAAERKLMEEKLKHSLDPENSPNDEQSVISILLDTSTDVDGDVVKGTPSKDYLALQDDWLKRAQESPFWIRPDGIVRNGNRRLAMLKRMRTEKGIESTRFVSAIILETSEINEQELFEMEQREQLTDNFKQRYTDINLLLTLREAAEAQHIDWNNSDDVERVAGELQEFVGADKSYAAIQLRAIKYMDDYLNDIDSPGEYQKLMGQIERFRDVGKIMAKMEQYPDDAVDMLRLQFAGITAGIKHGHIRSIGKIFREDRERYRLLRDKISEIEQQNPQQAKLESPDLVTLKSERDDDGDPDEPPPVVSNYPSAERVKAEILDTIDAFESKNLETARKLAQVLSRLRVITKTHLIDGLKGSENDEVRQLLVELIAWADAGKALLQ
jgi:hypothetical protein